MYNDRNKVKTELYLTRQDNTTHKCLIKLSFFKNRTRQIKIISKLVILIEMVA